MSLTQLSPPSLPYSEAAAKIGVSLAVGLLVGLEREWAQKEVGVRTFGIVALLGTLASLIGTPLLEGALIAVLLIVTLMNAQSLLKDRSLELTTSAALVVTLVLGALVGMGHYFTAATAAILMTMLLAWKVELARFADALQPDEIRGAVLLGLLSFVIYPLLPAGFVDRWQLLNPRQAWVMVIVIAGIGFVNYVLLRLYSERGIFYAAVLGGLVNSSAAAAELAHSFSDGRGSEGLAVSSLLLTNVSMFARNIVILAIFAASAVYSALPALAGMALLSAALTWIHNGHGDESAQSLRLSSPVSLRRVLSFGVVFLALACAGTLAQRYLGHWGFLVVSALGGLVSSASTTASAAALVSAGTLSPQAAGIATVLASISSAIVTLPLVHQQTGRRSVTIKLTTRTLIVVAVGLAIVGFQAML